MGALRGTAFRINRSGIAMLKTALVHDWLVSLGGAEKALSAIAELYPAPIHTLIADPKKLQGTPFEKMEIRSSFIQKCPFAARSYRHYLPLFPLAMEQFNLSSFDLIISSSHAVAKGVLTHSNQLHLCYCYTPMRYAWDLTHQYLEGVKGLQKPVAKMALHYLRNWDIASLGRVDHFATISHFIRKRIKRVYGRDATVIYPPVNVDQIMPSATKEEYFITISRLVPYKKIDLIVEAFSHLPDQRLLVIGDGPEMGKIKSLAKKNVEILGSQTDSQMHQYLSKAKGFIFAAEEDFGIVVVEAQAAGVPVIALGKGGCLETVIENETGLFYPDQTVASLVEAIKRFEGMQFDPVLVRENALRFSLERFKREFKLFVENKVMEFYENHHSSRW